MGVLVKLHTFICNKILLYFLLEFLPDLLRLAVLGTRILWKHYKLVRANRAYVSAIDNKSLRFSYHGKNERFRCSICLSEFEDGEEGRRVVDCFHVFHRRRLEKWVVGYCKATCPLCPGPVAEEAVVAEYREMRVELEDSEWIEKELALILLSAAWRSSCNGCPLCVFPEYIVRDVKTPLFLLETKFDTYQIGNLYLSDDKNTIIKACSQNFTLCTPSHFQMMKDYGSAITELLQEIRDTSSIGMFVHPCLRHGHFSSNLRWNSSYKLKNKTIAEAVGDWYNDRDCTTFQEIDTDHEFPLNTDCTKLPNM